MSPPFPLGWWSFDLGSYRPCDGTYQLYPYASIPPLDESLFAGDFQWLIAEAGAAGLAETADFDDETAQRVTEEDDAEDAVAALEVAAAALGLVLPPAFVRFMGDTSLQSVIPSVTACEWDLGAAPVPCRVHPGAYTVRFLRDQQDCLFWYLYLSSGEASVICSTIAFDDRQAHPSAEQITANTVSCAPHFEHFVYRFWLENELWESLQEKDPELTPEQRAYLAHYAQQ
jgi:hypothetical protein